MMRWTWCALCVMALVIGGCGGDEPAKDDGKKMAGGGGEDPRAGPSRRDAPLGIAAGKIVFRYEGKPEGTVTAWFQDHGATVVLLDETTYVNRKTHSKIIWRDKKTTLHDFIQGTTTHPPVRVRATELQWQVEQSPEVLERGGHKRLPDETIAGLECAVWQHEVAGTTVWVHKHILLKQITKVGGKVYQTQTAVSFEPLDAIPAEAFEIPAK